MPLDSKSLLARQKDEILKALVAGSADKGEAQRLVDLLTQTEKMASALADKPSGKPYTACRKAIDAIMLYLEQRGRPATKEEIVGAVVGGGFLEGDQDADLSVGKSIMIHIRGTGTTGKAAGKIKAKGDVKIDPSALIGLYKWNDEMFS